MPLSPFPLMAWLVCALYTWSLEPIELVESRNRDGPAIADIATVAMSTAVVFVEGSLEGSSTAVRAAFGGEANEVGLAGRWKKSVPSTRI